MTTYPLHIINPRDGHPHTHTVVLLHGRDSTNEEFASEFFESEASEPAGQPRTLRDLFPTTRWVFPAAPVLRAARFGADDVSQWFDVWSVKDPAARPGLQHAGLRRSAAAIRDVVRDEQDRLAHRAGDGGEQQQLEKRVFLAGISQGFAAAVAAFVAGAGGPRGLAGLIGLCSWMPLGGEEALVQVLLGDARDHAADAADAGAAVTETTTRTASMPEFTPVLLCHSTDDDVVPVQNGRALRDILGRSQDVEWHEYEDGGHWVNEPRGVDDIASFLRRHMSKLES